MRSYLSCGLRPASAACAVALLATGISCGSSKRASPSLASASRGHNHRVTIANTPGTPINLTAQRMTTALRDGTAAPMWGFCDAASTCTDWAPGPTIVATAGDSLQINLTNNLPVPTSLVVLGQLGGGLGTPQKMSSPVHTGQQFTTFAGNAPADIPFVPPAQGPRVRSFGTEVPAASSTTLTWASLRPGTYLYETGTMPSLQVPMGLYGVLVVNAAPGTAYPGVSYDSDTALLFSEMDPVQNAAVDNAAAHDTGDAFRNLRFNDPACTPNCYPAAVNYTPTYFFINGKSFDRTAPQNSQFTVGDSTYSSGNVLVRLLNAGSRTHIPSIVGLPLSLVAEDGNPAPGLPKVENEVLLTAGKTYDAIVRPAAGTGLYAGGYAPNTFPVFDRQLSLSTANHPDGGMQGFLLVNHNAAAEGHCSNQASLCTTDASCYTGSCASGLYCAGTTTACTSDGSCATPGSCASGLYCNGTTTTCTVDGDCATAGSCVSGTYCAGTANACTTDASCFVGSCSGGLCNGTTNSCTTDADCVVAGACGAGAYCSGTTTACTSDASCAPAGSCATASFCSGTTTACTSDATCAAPGSCTTASYCSGTTTACAGDSTCVVAGSCSGYGAAGDPGMLPATVAPQAVADTFQVPCNGTFHGDVTVNDIGVTNAAVVAGNNPALGTLTFSANGTFTYVPAACAGGTDSFTYNGNGGTTNTVSVTLNLASAGAAPTANNDSYSSNIAGKFSLPRPGVLANDTDPSGYPLTAGSVAGSTCTSVTLNADGSLDVTASGASCQFSYTATNSQGTASAPATVTIAFGTASGLHVGVVDAMTGLAIPDYRWTLQEDLTFKHDISGTPSLSTRTIGTSFHRSHMTVVATGCVGAVSCGSGQSVRVDDAGTRHVVTDAEALAKQTTPDQVALDPTRNYYISILPGDAGNPSGGCDPAVYSFCDAGGAGHIMGGAEIKAGQSYATGVTVKLQSTALVPAQISIYIYEDNQPTNGQNEPVEQGLGGFNIILMDPAGRTGDVAGQQTYDAFNMPLANYLLGSPGCPDELNTGTNGTGTNPAGNTVGVVYTCPNPPPGYTGDPAVYALAGHALIKNLTPARYDVIAHPGAAREGAGEIWWQTETLEGTPAQDAFTGIKEPVYFQEFGPPGFHTTIGFVNPGHVAGYASANGLVGTHTVTGKVTNQHMSRPSDVTLWDSGSYDMLFSTTCQVVLNSQAGDGPAVAAAECNPDGTFTLSNVPAGDYDLAVFDQWLDQIIQNVAVSVPAAVTTVDMGDIPVLSWFTQQDLNIYMDLNKNGVYDANEPGISNVPLSVRYRNGAPSNTTLSDSNGNGILVELFPLFNWYVTEADTTRFKQTGVNITVDGGGKPDTTGPGAALWSSTYADGTSSVRVEQPGALSYGIQGFISQRNRVDWGRTPYVQGENGGITGYVVYSSTRPFDDMRFNVQTIWEPLVPRVTMNLYRQQTLADGTQTLTLVDSTKTTSWDDFVNLVYGADSAKYLLGTDGKLRDPNTGALAPASAYPAGKQVNLQCPGQLLTDPFVNYTLGTADAQRCYDGWHGWNQVQAAPYDGRYVFPSAAYVAAHAGDIPPGGTLVSLPPGTYVVEAVTPPGYEIVKEEDKNILIGDAFVAPATQQFGGLGSIFILPDQATLNNANPYNPGTGDPGFQSDPTTNLGVYGLSTGTIFPECVGNLHRVPDFLSLYPQAQQVAPFAGMDRPLCDRKKVVLNDQMQTSATFFVFTETPVASNNTGIILDDATSEFNAVSPDFGEKASVPFVPVSIKDFNGLELSRTYSDQWGAYNMMTPSSWLVNPPTPSGYGPNMLITCMNDPGPIADPATGQLITDPAYNPSYSNFCYTNPFMPGQTTYLDTPVLPIAAFASGYTPPDCAQPDAAPVIRRVDSDQGFGPWVSAADGTHTLTITAMGDMQVPNPAYEGPFAASGLASQHTITRHYGFGNTAGTVTVGGVPLTGVSWSDGTIVGTVPAGATTGELVVTAANGQSTVDAVTVTVGGAVTRVTPSMSIQAAVDAASPGDLIMIDAGTYNELVIMWKPVRLQGVGAGSVIINAAKYPNSKLEAWRPRINQLFNIDTVTGNQIGPAQVDPLPTQEITGGVVLLEPTVLGSEEGAGITVLAKNLPLSDCYNYGAVGWESNFLCAQSRIDGISVTGGDAGGGIYVNGWAHGLEISNNRVYGNAGAYNGGIRVGVPYLELTSLPTDANGNVLVNHGKIAGFGYDEDVRIHHNSVTKNGTVEAPIGNGGAGGGVSIQTGTDNYSVDHNYICGNYSASDGGGIGHLGFSQNGRITNNQILFNQSFQQTNTTHGGGIFVSGEPPIAGALSLGTGDLTIDANLIRGNFAEGGHGGGIRLQQVNGADVAAFNQPGRWHQVKLTNNMIVNNVAGWSGGGISLSDTLRAVIDNNTVSSNDSTGIAGTVLAGGVPLPAETPGNPGGGYPSPSGVASEPTSSQLLAVVPAPMQPANAISQPELVNNVIWQNRSFFYSGDGRLCVGNSFAEAAAAPGACNVLPDQSTSGQCVSGAEYWDLGVLGDSSTTPGANQLNPTYSVLTTTAGYAGPGNTSSDPKLVNQYCNGSRAVPELPGVIDPATVKNLAVAATIDEGNNYVNLRYGPLYTVNPATGTAFGDYHITDKTSAAYNTGTSGGNIPDHDYDMQPRPLGGYYDIGADELFVPPTMAVSPTSLAFGNVSEFTTKTLPVTVSNNAAATENLVLATPTISGGNSAAKYSVAAGTCLIGGTGLAPGTSCTLNVTFAPTSAGPGMQTSNLNVNAANAATITVSLTGRGVIPIYSITPGPLVGHDFGTEAVGTQSPPFQFTVTNLASSPGQLWLTGNPVSSGTYASQFPAAFRAGDTCTATTHLVPGASCTFSVVFAPTSAGTKGTGVLNPGARVDVTHEPGPVNIGSPVWGTGL